MRDEKRAVQDHGTETGSWIDRRGFLIGAGAAGIASGGGLARAYTQAATAPDFMLRIAPLRLELAPGKIIDTVGYNGAVPGPLLRMREGRQASIDIRNDSDIDDIVHWHGLYLPSASDGAMEEGSPMVERGNTRRYTFAARPAGTRWYHSHDVAGTDLRRSLYSGMYGFLIIDPADDSGRYDQEILLAAHHWEPRWVSMQDLRKDLHPTTGSKCCMPRRPSMTGCWATASRSGFVPASACCSGCSIPARPRMSGWRCPVIA